MKRALLILLLTSSHTVFADDASELHAAQCVDCHSRMTGGDGHVIYTRDERIVTDLSALQARVKHCAEGSNANWSDTQIEHVTEYLNNQYYHY